MIVIAGATGNTGRPAAEALLAKGEVVRVTGRRPEKLEPLIEQGAEAFVANAEDAQSMARAWPARPEQEGAASIVGQAVGKPGLGSVPLPFARLEPALVQMGLPKAPLRCSSKLAGPGMLAF